MNRTFNEETRKIIQVWMERVIKGICSAYGCVYPQHSNHFTIDEDAFPIGVACYAQATLDFLNKKL